MSEQHLDDADVHALLEHVRGKAVAQRVRPELVVEAALASRLLESGPCRGVGQVRDDATTGKQPRPAAMDLPDLSKHLQDGVCQREGPLLVPFADNVQYHLLRVDRRDRQRDRLFDPQSIGVDEHKATAIDRLFECGDQAATILVAADVGQPLLAWLADFFLVSRGHS